MRENSASARGANENKEARQERKVIDGRYCEQS